MTQASGGVSIIKHVPLKSEMKSCVLWKYSANPIKATKHNKWGSGKANTTGINAECQNDLS